MPKYPHTFEIEHNDFEWFNVYPDLLGIEAGKLTGYVECFKSTNGKYSWEILGDIPETLDCVSGYASSVEAAQNYVEKFLSSS